jgi:predicted permease
MIRAIARLLIRGPEAPYVLTDLDDAFERDVAAGLPHSRAQRRYLINMLASALSVLGARLRAGLPRFSMIDARLGLRMLTKYPGLTLVATFALAVGIPVGLMPMHAVDAFEAHLPEDPDGRIHTLRYWNVGQWTSTTTGDLHTWQRSLTSFERLGASRQHTYEVEFGQTGLQLSGAEVTASTFEILGTAPVRGRTLYPADEALGAPKVVIIREDVGRATGVDPLSLVGTTLRIGGVPHDIVGVMPERFQFPRNQQLWLPLREPPVATPREGRPLTIFGQLWPGVTPEAAQAELSTVQASLAAELPDVYARLSAEVVPSSFMTFAFPKGGLRAMPEFAIVQVLTLVPLLIACVNVGLLIFARTSTRTGEFAVRTALGASRSRILTQVFTESLVLALLATGVGLGLLYVLPSRVLGLLEFFPMPYWLQPELSTGTVLRACGLAGASAAIAGVIPVLRTTSMSVQRGLQRAAGQRSGTRFGLSSSVMIVADVAVAVAATGFAIGIAHRVAVTLANEQTDGIRAEQFLSATLTVPDGQAQEAIVERLRNEPGVRSATAATVLPRMDHPTRLVEIDGEAQPLIASGHRVRVAAVAPGYFEALGKAATAGRTFDRRDLSPGAASVMVNTTFVERALGGRSAVGRRLRYVTTDGAEPGPWHEIVGVVGHLGMHSLTPTEDDGVYQVMAYGSTPSIQLAIATDGDPMALTSRVRTIARDVDARAVISGPTTLDQVFEGDWYLMTAIVGGATLLVGVLLALAASALYAIMSFTIAERTREFGIRMALGADRRRIVLQVARRALIQIGLGVLIGLPLAGSIFFEMQEQSTTAPSAWLAVGLALAQGLVIMLLVAFAACLGPTRRALRISPVEALRQP